MLRDTLRTPQDAMQIGADLGSSGLDAAVASRFVGLIESVRVHSGVAP